MSRGQGAGTLAVAGVLLAAAPAAAREPVFGIGPQTIAGAGRAWSSASIATTSAPKPAVSSLHGDRDRPRHRSMVALETHF